MKGRPPAIAIVDDDASLRKALRRLLRVNGYEAEGYASGQEFLDSLDASPPDCVLLDVRMIPISGLEVHREMLRRRLPLPVIFISAENDCAVRERLRKQGAVAFLQKPFAKQALLALLTATLAAKERT